MLRYDPYISFGQTSIAHKHTTQNYKFRNQIEITGGSLTLLVTIVAAVFAIGGAVSRILRNRYRSEDILKFTILIAMPASVIALANLLFQASSWLQFSAIVAYGLCSEIINVNAAILAM